MFEILLNPNVAYVLLVVGFVLGLLALITPGTGLLEVGALFCLLLAGYAVYQVGFNLWALIILVLSIVPFVLAIRRTKRRKSLRGLFLALSILGVVIGSAYLFQHEGFLPTVNPVLASVVSVLAGGFIWISVQKTLQAYLARPSHDLDVLVGQDGEAKTEIYEEGSVQVSGELWTARSDRKIPAGSKIRVVKRDGFILTVERTE